MISKVWEDESIRVGAWSSWMRVKSRHPVTPLVAEKNPRRCV